ncbi:MAG: hypothetical protein AB201_02600 [Parcubacteria bacterium C7867-006]|nr:MAG: hypothetical protein AB201_02600 [Parcubacteria bacterium C7867-006]
MSLKQFSILLCRFSLFIIYFWFGLLKVVGLSPASPMVHKLFDITVTPIIPFMPFSSFIVLFGLFEMLIGILFFVPKMEKIALSLFAFHVVTTMLPLFFMAEVWQKMFVPTLEGQYIIKNIALIACALNIYISLETKESPVGKINSAPLTFS